jgi:small GTP-binding protein
MVDISAPDGESSEPIRRILKFLVIGEPNTGKTSLIRRYVQNCFTEHYRSTIGVDFAHKDFEFDSTISGSVQLWDVSGSQRFSELTRMYYQGAVGAFVVFDVSDLKSLEATLIWKRDVDQKVITTHHIPIPILLVGNKLDLCPDGWGKSMEEMNQFRIANNFVGFIQTSAKSAYNVEEAIRALIHYVIENNVQAPSDIGPSLVHLDEVSHAEGSPCC